MPQTGMDYWVIAGVVIAAAAAFLTWRSMRKPTVKTTNKVVGGSGNTQTGGNGTTSNEVDRGDNNNQSG